MVSRDDRKKSLFIFRLLRVLLPKELFVWTQGTAFIIIGHCIIIASKLHHVCIIIVLK